MAGHCGHNWCFASMRGQFACAIVQMLTVCRIEWAQSQLKDCVFIKYLFNLFLACTQDSAVTEHTSPWHATPPQPCPAHFPDKLKRIKSILSFVHYVKLFTYFLILVYLSSCAWSWLWNGRCEEKQQTQSWLSFPLLSWAGAWVPVSVVCTMGSWLFMFSVDVI